jgi:hypothetical protein
MCEPRWIFSLMVVAYIALAILAFLMLANVVITWARLTRHRHFAGRVVEYLEPFALLFRAGNPRQEGSGLGGRGIPTRRCDLFDCCVR